MRHIKNCLKKSYEKCQFLICGRGTHIYGMLIGIFPQVFYAHTYDDDDDFDELGRKEPDRFNKLAK